MIQIPSVLKLRSDVDETRRPMAIVAVEEVGCGEEMCCAISEKEGLARVVRKGEKQKVSAGV